MSSIPTTAAARVRGVRLLLVAVLTLLGSLAMLSGAPAAQAAPAALVPAAAEPAGITSSREDALGSGGRHMSSDVTWYPAADGRPDRLVGTTRTWNNVKLTGFTGCVVVLFVNKQGQVVGFSPTVFPLGVDGRWIGRWSRSDAWQFDIPADQTRGAVGIEIVHSRGGKNRLGDILGTIKGFFGGAKTARTLVSG